MSLLLYNIFLFFFRVGTGIASIFDAKAKKWVAGRKRIFTRLKQSIPPGEKIIWVHCASLGEFEQGRPVMEELKKKFGSHKILLSFFSPSGYEAQKNYAGADWIFYLPIDGPRNARRFLEIVHPELVIFVKYEFWYYYLKKIKYRQVPLLLISALFRKDMSFFKWYGGLQRKILSRFDRLFVQNESSKKLLDKIGLSSITNISGDTRFDRVIEIAEKFEPIPLIEGFTAGSRCLVAGSTWPEDERVLQKTWTLLDDPSMKLIIAPHEIDKQHIQSLQQLFPGALLFSELQPGRNSNILIIDNIGMLSRLYKYAYTCYVGGGFVKNGVHNVLEAAVYGKPVLWGPYYKKYSEIIGLKTAGGGLSIRDEKELINILRDFASRKQYYDAMTQAAANYVRQHAGATRAIISYIQEKRLLTS